MRIKFKESYQGQPKDSGVAQLDTEFVHNIKQKLELLLKTLIEEYQLESLISNKFRYRTDYDSIFDSEYYKFYEDKMNAKGEQYHYGTNYVPESFQDWLDNNFPDFTHSERIYNHLCQTGFVTQEDLRLLNTIYKKHPPKTA